MHVGGVCLERVLVFEHPVTLEAAQAVGILNVLRVPEVGLVRGSLLVQQGSIVHGRLIRRARPKTERVETDLRQREER